MISKKPTLTAQTESAKKNKKSRVVQKAADAVKRISSKPDKRADSFSRENKPAKRPIRADRVVAALAALVLMLTITGSAFTLNEYKLANAATLAQPTVTRSLGVNMQKRSYTPSVSYKLSLAYSSVELDLSVSVVDEFGALVKGYPFEVTVTPAEGGDSVSGVDEDKDGEIYFEELAEGEYSVALAPAEGFIVSEEPITAAVSPKVTYERVNVAEKIKQQSEINASEDDPQYGGGGGADGDGGAVTTPTDTDTVEFVPSDKKETSTTTQKPLVDAGGNPIVKYTVKLSSDGYILNADGTASEYKAVVDSSGYLTGATKVVTVAAGVSTNGGFTVTFLSAETGEQSTTETPAETTEPTAPPVTPPEPAPTPAPVTKTVSYTLSGGELVPDDGSGNVNITSVFSATAVPQTEAVVTTTTTYYGWQTIDGKTYFFDKNGIKVTGRQVIQGVNYTFDSNGVMTGESGKKTVGIDISTYQENINWAKVKAAGVSFVIIRLGFRGYVSGSLVEDSDYRSHINGATGAGLKVGVYFFTQAINEKEAVEEASMCIQLVRGYNLAYPIAIDIEYAAYNARTNGMSNAQRTKVCVAFCETVRSAGYNAAVYANKYYFTSMLNTSQLERYVIWLAHYTEQTSYARRYDIWQYSSRGSVNGIPGNVDMNISYLPY